MNPFKSKTKQPLVSVIILSYNHASYIKEAIDSVLDQSYKNIEIIIIDDNSTDGSAAILKNYKDKARIFFFKENQGVCSSLNFGFSHAKGQFLIRLDTDDKFKKNAIEELVDFLQKNPDVDFVYYPAIYFGEKSGLMKTQEFDVHRLKLENYIHCSALMKKEVFIKNQGFDLYLNRLYLEDWEFWINAAENGFVGKMLDRPLLFYRQYGNIRASRNRPTKKIERTVIRHIRMKHWRFFGLKFFITRATNKLKKILLKACNFPAVKKTQK